MKLLTYTCENNVSFGVLGENGIVDIGTCWAEPDRPRSVKQVLAMGPYCLEKLSSLADSADTFIPLSSVKLLAPIPNPGKLVALAGNYSKHIIEAGLKLGLADSPRETTVPRPFLMPGTVVSNPDSEIPWPRYSEEVDYEVELAVVIGKKARCVSVEEAIGFVAGYTVVNDVSARSVTFKENRGQRPWDEFFDWLGGKWSDGFLPIGPWIVTCDEVGDAGNLGIELKVNGQVRQSANTGQMIFGISEIVSFVSHIMTLNPGDIIATGTPEGVGMATGDFLKPGDKMECTIKKIGTLKNTLGAYPQDFYKPLVTGIT
ncbi:MAG: fumarylacetoacetate hydrolase family protein [Planctomycetes bacterium]|nr:fumarylacetoacetate hydrolase family protein [Planctomycetota bacterium]